MKWLLLTALLFIPVSVQAEFPAAVGVYPIPNSQVQTFCEFPTGTNAGQTGCGGLVGDSGAAYDDRRGRMLILGGGHGDYHGNEIIGVTRNASNEYTMARIRNGSPNGLSFGGACSLADGQPRAFHTYSNLSFVKGVDADGFDNPTNDRHIWLFLARSSDGFISFTCTWVLNPNTMAYTVGPDMAGQGSWAFDRNGGYWGGMPATDEVNRRVYVSSQSNISYFTVSTTGVVSLTTPTQVGFGDEDQSGMVGVIDHKRERYYIVGNGRIRYFSIAAGSNYARVAPATTGCGSAFNGGPGVVYYPIRDGLVVHNGGSTYTHVNTAVTPHVCTVQTLAGDGTAVPNGTFGRFRFDKATGGIISCNSHTQNCNFIRLDARTTTTDFTTRANAAGVTNSEGFENPAHLTDGQHYFPGSAGTAGRALDTNIKTSGNSSLALIIPAGNSSATPSGEWRVPMIAGTSVHTGGPGFPENSIFYYSFRLRITPTMYTNMRDFWRAGSDLTGWKHLNLHNMPQGSCGPVEFTGTTTIDAPTVTGIWYTACSAPGTNSGGTGIFNAGGAFAQQGNNTQATATLGYWCQNYTVIGNGLGQGCWNWHIHDEWLTFIGRIKLGAWGTATSKINLWVLREGSTTPLPIIAITGFPFNANPGAANRLFNMASLTNFMTGRTTSAPTSATMWYDEMIFSRLPIEFPGVVIDTPVPPDTTPPAVPTGLAVQ